MHAAARALGAGRGVFGVLRQMGVVYHAPGLLIVHSHASTMGMDPSRSGLFGMAQVVDHEQLG